MTNFASQLRDKPTQRRNQQSAMVSAKTATISLFKTMATLTHDNRESASREWGRTWGMSWWRSLWRYREYTLGNLVYRVGNVVMRHESYQYVECEISGAGVSKAKFLKEFAKLLESGIVLAPKPVEVAPVAMQVVQPSLFD